MTKPLQILSLGAGVQSSTLLLMSCHGDLPMLDAAIFADTGWESQAVYDHLDWMTEIARDIGISVYVVSNGSLRENALRCSGIRDGENSGMDIPAWSVQMDGSRGKINRSCTREFKINPIERFIRREMMGLEKGQVAPRGAVEQWFGISSDELRRVRSDTCHWKRNVYPLVGLPEPMLPHPYSRDDCRAWLAEHYPDQPVPSSSCLGCPFHSDAEWRQVQANPREWADTVEVDRAIRNSEGMRGELYLHRSGKPLEGVDLRTDADKGQGLLFGPDEECLGYCGT